MRRFWIGSLLLALAVTATSRLFAQDNTPPPGFTALFNGKNLDGWQGLVSVKERKKMSPEQYAEAVKKANAKFLPHWKVENGVIVYDGKGNNLQTVKDYGNFELYCDWKIEAGGDSGLYLRGNPQVQIWDPKKQKGIGSGGLYNNQKAASKPLVLADNPVGEWNTFHIKMVSDKCTIKLNGKVVVDDTPLENYWERGTPLPSRGPIELQHHGDHLWFKNIYVKELD